MIKFLKAIFSGSAEKKPAVNLEDAENAETKKCLNCLRRIKISSSKCPYCGDRNFQY